MINNNELIDQIKSYNRFLNSESLSKAYNFALDAHQDQKREEGVPYIIHPVAVANILTELKLDSATITTGLLHDTIEDTNVTYETVKREFGEEVANLVDGVTKLSDIKFNSREQKQAENFMKMFLSVASDIRVIIIKFSDRLHNMQTINYLPLIKQRRIAVETRDVYAPLAHRLGLYSIKTELEDLGLKFTKPEVYKAIAEELKATKQERNKYITKFTRKRKSNLRKREKVWRCS